MNSISLVIGLIAIIIVGSVVYEIYLNMPEWGSPTNVSGVVLSGGHWNGFYGMSGAGARYPVLLDNGTIVTVSDSCGWAKVGAHINATYWPMKGGGITWAVGEGICI